MILVLCAIGFIVSPAFLPTDNLVGVVQQSTELSLLVLAEALILISGRMDLSLESTIGVAPVLALALAAYPDAKVMPESGGLVLHPSRPPVEPIVSGGTKVRVARAVDL